MQQPDDLVPLSPPLDCREFTVTLTGKPVFALNELAFPAATLLQLVTDWRPDLFFSPSSGCSWRWYLAPPGLGVAGVNGGLGSPPEAEAPGGAGCGNSAVDWQSVGASVRVEVGGKEPGLLAVARQGSGGRSAEVFLEQARRQDAAHLVANQRRPSGDARRRPP
ncbi:hypothetical protein [Amycolatopsis sp. NPDC050768]|uniref:hypothetical protein n=1 Tax=Amycolatopsis sp. NPDC050768 TaxID=3154839 RepID=UPI0033F34982